MYVIYEGWSKTHGSFSCKIHIDENKQDYEIHFGDGTVSKQQSPFQDVTADWNHDGDVYTLFGAWFQSTIHSGSEFWTPVDLVRGLADSMALDRRPRSSDIVAVPGIHIPLPERRISLDERIRMDEQRAFHQETERNRKMNALGIRSPNEPWAR